MKEDKQKIKDMRRMIKCLKINGRAYDYQLSDDGNMLIDTQKIDVTETKEYYRAIIKLEAENEIRARK